MSENNIRKSQLKEQELPKSTSSEQWEEDYVLNPSPGSMQKFNSHGLGAEIFEVSPGITQNHVFSNACNSTNCQQKDSHMYSVQFLPKHFTRNIN